MCLDWFNENLVYGHDLGITVLSRSPNTQANSYSTEIQKKWEFKKNYFHLGKSVELVRYRDKYVAAVHPTFDITLVDTQSGKLTLLGGSSGHSSYINSVDISINGLVASTGDDRALLIWDDGTPFDFPLGGVGKIVKFWNSADSNIVVVLEAGNKIRVLNYQTKEWMLTIYPGQAGCCGPSTGSVKDIMITDKFLYAIGLGWWKKYDLENIYGGCGFTTPVAEQTFFQKPLSSHLVISNSRFIGLATAKLQLIYDTNKNKLYSLDFNLPDDEITGLTISSTGEAFIIATGNILTLISLI